VDPGVIELQRDVLRLGHPLRVKLHGMSMHPLIRAGDVVVVRSVPWTALRRGDVAYYERECRLVAHRVMVAPFDEDAPLITKGDTLSNYDPPARPEQLIGRVEAIERNGRAISLVGRRFWVQRLAAEWSGPYSALFWKVAAVRRRILRGMLRVPAYRSYRRRTNPVSPTLRPYRDDDLDSLANCVWDLRRRLNFAQARGWLQGYLEELRSTGATVWVTDDGRRLVGMASWLVEGRDARMVDWYVHPLARGLGWGKLFLSKAISQTTEQGAHSLTLAIPPDAAAAKNLLRKAGGRKQFESTVVAPPGILSSSGGSEEVWTFDLRLHAVPNEDEIERPSPV
jgi:ribosomal protein S18 acetylase RimI-like enzyme